MIDRSIDRRERAKRVTLGADKAYDVSQFVQDLRDRSFTPHIAIDGHVRKTGKPRKTAVDARTTRHKGYGIGQRCRERIEEAFGWIKSSAGLAKAKLRGRRRLHSGARGLQPDPAAQASGGASMSVRGRWNIVKTPGYDMHLAGAIAQVAAGRAALAGIAARHGLQALPSATNFVTIDCGRDGDHAKRVLDRLLARRIFVRMPGVAPINRCIRVTVGTPADIAAFAEALAAALA